MPISYSKVAAAAGGGAGGEGEKDNERLCHLTDCAGFRVGDSVVTLIGI